MSNGESTIVEKVLPLNHNEIIIPGLRDIEKAPDCKVFKVNPDGTKGSLLRIEKVER